MTPTDRTADAPSDDLEAQLRATLARRAAAVPADLAPPPGLPDRRAPLAPLLPAAPARRPTRRTAVLAAAAVVAVLGLLGLGLVVRDQDGETPVASGPSATPTTAVAGPPPAVAPPTGPIWPVTDPLALAPLATDPRLATPEGATRAYLAEVAGLPDDWPLGAAAVEGGTATVPYVLQDLAARVQLESSRHRIWHVVSATNELAPISGVVRDGAQVTATIGPSRRGSGFHLRIAALGADRTEVEVIDTTMVDAAPKTITIDAPGAAVLEVDVLDDHDADPETPEVVIAHSAAAVGGDDDRQLVPAQDAPRLPAGYDPATAPAVFAAPGADVEVLDAWLRARFPDHDRFATALVGEHGEHELWSWSVPVLGDVGRGRALLRPTSDGHEVVYALADDVSLAGLVRADGRVRGAARSRGIDSLFADVLRLDGILVSGTPRPDGYARDSEYRFGTAAGPADGELALDVPLDPSDGPPLVRISSVGGTILNVSEVVLPAP